MFCPNCGRKLPDGARFCSGCGSQLAAPAPAAAPVAPKKRKKRSKAPLIIALVLVLLLAAGGAAAYFLLCARGGPALWSNLYQKDLLLGEQGAIQVGERILRREHDVQDWEFFWRVMEPDGHGGYTPGQVLDGSKDIYDAAALDGYVFAAREGENDRYELTRIDLDTGTEKVVYQGERGIILCGTGGGRLWFTERHWDDIVYILSVDAKGAVDRLALRQNLDTEALYVTDSGIYAGDNDLKLYLLDFQGGLLHSFAGIAGTEEQYFLRESGGYIYLMCWGSEGYELYIVDKETYQARNIGQAMEQYGLVLADGTAGAFEFGKDCFYLVKGDDYGKASLYQVSEETLEPELIKTFYLPSSTTNGTWLYMVERDHFWVGTTDWDSSSAFLTWTDVTLD